VPGHGDLRLAGREQILQYFELSYGQFVLLEPKFEGVTGAVWVLPVVALLAGIIILYFKLRKLDGSAAPEPAIVEAPEAVADPYLSRVRELVGDKP
jgi:cytochrome c-type biogenesis protein CcmH/NrfF